MTCREIIKMHRERRSMLYMLLLGLLLVLCVVSMRITYVHV